MLSMLGHFLGICVSSTTALVRRKRQYWFACGTLLLMLNPVSAHAIVMFAGTFPGSDPLNSVTFAGNSSTNYAELVVTGGNVRVSDFRSSTVLL